MPYDDEHATYYPPELVNPSLEHSDQKYHCYLIKLDQKYEYEVPPEDIVLAVRSELEYDVGNINFDLQVDRGTMTVSMSHIGVIHLNVKMVSYLNPFAAIASYLMSNIRTNNADFFSLPCKSFVFRSFCVGSFKPLF